MKKYLLSVLILCFVLLCSCDNIYDYADFMLINTDKDRIEDTDIDTSGTKYIMSKNGSTYHLESCYIVRNMKEENKRIFYDKQFFIDREISPCSRCKP